MTQQPQRPTEVLGALPHRRPSRRSEKRGPSAPPSGGRAPAKADQSRPRSAPSLPHGREIVGTTIQAAAELAEIGLSASARAIREAVARLPRP